MWSLPWLSSFVCLTPGCDRAPPCEAQIATFVEAATRVDDLARQTPFFFDTHIRSAEVAGLPRLDVDSPLFPSDAYLGILAVRATGEVVLNGAWIGDADDLERMPRSLRVTLDDERARSPQTPPWALLVAADADVAASTVVALLDGLGPPFEEEPIDIDIAVVRDPAPEVPRVPTPAGFAGWAEAEAETFDGTRALLGLAPGLPGTPLAPYLARLEAEVDAVPACPVDFGPAGRARYQDKARLARNARVEALRACDCAADVDLWIWAHQMRSLPETLVETLPLSLDGGLGSAPDGTWGAFLTQVAPRLRGFHAAHPDARIRWPLLAYPPLALVPDARTAVGTFHDHGVRFDYPGDWSFTLYRSEASVLRLRTPAEEGEASIEITVFPTDEVDTLRTAQAGDPGSRTDFDPWIEALAHHTPSGGLFALIPDRPVISARVARDVQQTIAGTPRWVREATYRVTAKGVTTGHTIRVVGVDNVYVATRVADGAPEALHAGIQQILDSLSFPDP